MSAKRIKIPQKLWASFIDVLYSAALHINPKSVDPECMALIQDIIRKALQDGSLMVIEGKIVGKKDYIES